ncbi:hypothetical protein GGR51DRAFT_559801 [Nemania sp. FL0031]|nr:hypothetical protein GGR51DRAFT_559801 [Nemania sp. FL0031]
MAARGPQNTSFSQNPNPRYKGKNYDPNYHANRNKNNYTVQDYVTQQWRQPNGKDTSQVSNFNAPILPNQNQRFNTGTRPNQQHQHGPSHPRQAPAPFNSTKQSLANAEQKIREYLTQDAAGDTRMCQCPKAGGPVCYHRIAALYQKQLVLSAQLQRETAELLRHFMSKSETVRGDIQLWSNEYLQNNPRTILSTVVQTMGQEGLVTTVPGATSGDGIEVYIDNILNLGIG